ncbi:MAG: cob(I)yrinic acid a,c-diamide adenosyltransferase [Proteobacteria bacterium]|nr:cob(I)yrinic acid a,c-diamide adenosyltransferase [Pseudomonadota bacterium]
MVRLTRIYTRGGDSGETSLSNGARVPKHSLRVAAIGDVDEANAAAGLARTHLSDGEPAAAILRRILDDLFDLGADLANPSDAFDDPAMLRITEDQVRRLESEIDDANAALAPLDSFVLPGGSAAAAHLHQARTVARRAERAMTALAASEPVNPAALRYINRVSDLFFVLSRALNAAAGSDVVWRPGANRGA